LAVLALTLALGGCRKQPPPPPEPVDEAPTQDLDAERRAAEERARLEAEEAARREAEARKRATLEEMVFFDYDDARINPEAQTKLGAKARILRDNAALRIRNRRGEFRVVAGLGG
jgi:outer membrane protein OmpA-like peptidoglycan-associated protein